LVGCRQPLVATALSRLRELSTNQDSVPLAFNAHASLGPDHGVIARPNGALLRCTHHRISAGKDARRRGGIYPHTIAGLHGHAIATDDVDVVDGRHLRHPVPDDVAPAPAINAQLEAVCGALERWDSGVKYANFVDVPTDTSTYYPAAAFDRLQEVKARYDPDDLFRANHPIPCPTVAR
jgi:hypothetical protein